jgi:hypothetical protein
MSRAISVLIAVVFGMALVLTGVGCEKIGKKLAKRAFKTGHGESDGEYGRTDGFGRQSERGEEREDDEEDEGGERRYATTPGDVPVAVDLTGLPDALRYPGARGTNRWSSSQEKTTTSGFVLETADPASAVITYYRNALKGWKEISSAENAQGTTLTLQSGDGKQDAVINVGSVRERNATGITIIVSSR